MSIEQAPDVARQPSDSAVRAAAIDPARSFLIQAPAGSGKTELLTDRILALLATVSRPEEIVAITFTRKAASEMHARVLAKLQGGRGPCPAEGYKRHSWQLAQKAMQRNDELGWNLLQYPARLSIRTIDSFCTYLVRAMPWLSALGGVPGITENPREHYEAAAQATLAMADEYESVARLIAHLDVDIRAAQSLVADMLASRDQWLPLLSAGGDIEQLLQNLDNVIESDLRRLAAAMPPGWASSLAPSVSRAANTLAAGESTMDLSSLEDWSGAPFGVESHCLAQWQALAGLLLTGKNTLRRTVTIKQGFEAKSDYKDEFLGWLKAVPDTEEWVALLADIRGAATEGYDEEQQEILAVLIEVLWLAAAQLNLRFVEAGEVDFAEISQRALQALGRVDDPSDLLLALDTVIRHILVDEFQDTSQSQIELLQRLTGGWTPGDGRTLFLVGDPMQSIYRFRKAEVGWFLRVKDEGLGGVAVTPLELTDNFRSQANLVEWVNRTCKPIFPKEEHPDLGAIPYTDSVAFNDGVDGVDVEFHPVWVRSKPKQGKAVQNRAAYDDAANPDDALPASEPSWVAESIAIQLARQALEDNANSAHPVAILVRARSHLDNVVHRLAQQNIPCRAVELVSLKSRQVVIDMVQLARALSHPADRLAWLSVLRSPLCGMTLHSLHALFGSDLQATAPSVLAYWLAQDSAGASTLTDAESLRLRTAVTVLLDGSNASGSIPFAAWLENVWRRLGGFDIYSSASDKADAESLLRLVEKLAPYGDLNPAELDERLAQLYAAPNSAGRAVEVMTIHKSKGLEFETVILLGLHRTPMADTPPLLRFEHNAGELLLGPIRHRTSDQADPVSAYLAQRDKKRAAYEADRLLYVALTRARRQLHLIGHLALDDEAGIKRPSPSSLLGRLWDQLPDPPVPEPEEFADGGGAEAMELPEGQRYLVRPALEEISLTPILRPTPVHVAPWRWQEAHADESRTGVVAHAWLEHIGRDGVDEWPIERVVDSMPVLRRQLSRAGLAAGALDEAAHILRDTLVATLQSPQGRWLLKAAKAHREWSLLDISGRVSVIDLAISQQRDWLVVDYKTGVPREGESLDLFIARMRDRYTEQIERYCAHVSALDGRPARGALYFPRADCWIDVVGAAKQPNSC